MLHLFQWSMIFTVVTCMINMYITVILASVTCFCDIAHWMVICLLNLHFYNHHMPLQQNSYTNCDMEEVEKKEHAGSLAYVL